ncbi:MAG TPA: C39 family peptidase [Terriglobia bacterium]|nr:C39 family peptidase [Terriglobia bacterium]
MRCAVKQGVLLTVLLLQAALAPAAAQGNWLDVPFVRQQADGCGSACISMVMRYWLKQERAAITPAADVLRIQKILYNRQARGIYASDMERYFRDNGFEAFAFSGTPEDLCHHVAKGRPLIVCLKDSGASGPLHYVVVAGIDDGEGIVLVNDPAQRKLLKMDLKDFETRWRPVHNWTLLAVPRPH